MNLILKVTSPDQRVALSHLLTLPLGLDIWETHDDHVILRAADAQAERLRHIGYGVEQMHQTESYLSAFAAAAAGPGYHTVASMQTDLQALATKFPNIAELHEIGRSIENRPIQALRISARVSAAHKILFLGCHHAREWVSVEVPYLLADYLLLQANQSPVQQWLQQGEIWVAPMVNPDGHEYTRVTDRLWRKNRRHNADGSFGVDPNRNYGYMWGTLNVSTSSHVPSDDTYVGPRAFSEPETRAVRNLIAQQRFGGVLTYHSYSQLLLYPWGYTSQRVTDAADRTRMTNLATQLRTLINGVHGISYTAEQSSQLYPTAGDTTDWAYGEYAIPAFTIELRPGSQAAGGFILPPDQIQPTFEENRPAALAFIKEVFDGP